MQKAELHRAELESLKREVAKLERGSSPAASAVRVSTGVLDLDASLGGGLARGALHEVFAQGMLDEAAAAAFVIGLALRASGKAPVVWVRQDFVGLELGSFPDSPTKEEEAEALTGSFIRRPKRVGDPGSYFTTFGTTVRHAYEKKSLAADAPIALKLMEVKKMKEMLNLERKNRSKGIDRSIVAMILLNTRTDYIPQLYGMSLGGRVGSDGRKFLWTEVEWIPESLEQVLASEEIVPEWMVLQVFYDEVLLRNLGVCIGDWKSKNVGFVTSQIPTELSVGGRTFLLPPGRRLKRMDPGELHFVQATQGKRRKTSVQNLNVPMECKISLTGWNTPSEVLNEAIPFYVEMLNEGNVSFLSDPKFLALFKTFEK